MVVDMQTYCYMYILVTEKFLLFKINKMTIAGKRAFLSSMRKKKLFHIFSLMGLEKIQDLYQCLVG